MSGSTSRSSALADLRRSILMLLPGLGGIIALAGLATGRIGNLSNADATTFLVFAQVELLALGVGRLGIDSLVLGRAPTLPDPDGLGFLRLLFRWVLPITVASAAVCALVIGGSPGVAVLVAAPLDLMSVTAASFALTRRRYIATIGFAWMNFPVFLAFLVVPGIKIEASTLNSVLVLFCSTSALRAIPALVIFARHSIRRSRIPAEGRADLTPRDLQGSAAFSVCHNLIQRSDGAILAVFDGRFPPAAVSTYIVASRLLDASYTVSGVISGLRHVRLQREAESRRTARLLLVGWVSVWVFGAMVLAALRYPHVFEGWGRLLLAAVAASLHLAMYQNVLSSLANSRGGDVVRQFAAFLVIGAVCGVLAVWTGEPAFMFVSAVVNGLVSLFVLRQRTATDSGRELAKNLLNSSTSISGRTA